ncbi:MAG TPA: efflux RND transporter permease subunit, partial [Campylobacteraceae bacterium]|nr:efflux RND transporter permease subunit [Campylobacteraceae bacterium]
MEKIIAWILQTKWRKRGVIAIVLMALGASVMMLPTKLVLAKMLPGKSANTFTIYIDLPTNSSIRQTAMVAECVGEHLKKEREVTDIETYLGQGAPLDYAGLVKGSDFKRMKYQAEVVVNLTDKHTREEPSFMMVHRLRPVIQHDCESMVEGTTIKFIEMPSGPPTLATIV